MVSAFIDMLGMLMILPLLPFYAEKLGAGGAIVGLLVASFSVAQLLSAPFWGRFSDRYGRRPALLVSLVASAIAFVVFAYADSLWLLFLSRIVQGAGGGTVGVIQAYVADATRPDDRARVLGWLSAATNAGVAIGPALGSWLRPLGAEWPGLVAAGLCVREHGVRVALPHRGAHHRQGRSQGRRGHARQLAHGAAAGDHASAGSRPRD